MMPDKQSHPEQDPAEGSRDVIDRNLEQQSKDGGNERQAKEKENRGN